MKKIGIITYHASHNCGSFMQSYAIQKYIEKNLNYHTEIINFSSEGQQELYAYNPKIKSSKQFIKKMLLLPISKQMKTIHKEYEQFINNNLNLSEKKYSRTSELNNIEENYDAFICGSDQIWNVKCPDYDDSYFLPSVKYKKKIAYAPSFGAMRLERHVTDIEKYRQFLLDFDSLSCREKNGKEWIEELTGRKVELVLDPTLLLDCEDYNDLIDQREHIDGEYIFYYSPKYDKSATKIVDKISKKYKLPVIMWNAKEWILRGMFLKGFKTPYHQNPGIYLDLIKNAKIVFTTSFHGAIFSTQYQKNFWVLKVGGMKGDDDRVLTLLTQLNLVDRFLDPLNYDESTIFNEINYEIFESNLLKLRKNSIQFLEENLGDINGTK